ncbi:hypothetical protein VNI00_003503 [Paramarasmius palmivorus]|uniref:Beta-lactamase-related domain-containing protein n=1 Tax=Paramarasmius palmivorus TaxID=297713 RepID=A0AAW0DS18_9AGAR
MGSSDLLLLPTAFAQNSASPVLSTQVDEFIQNLLKEWGTPGGVSVAVVRLGSSGTWEVETKGYGVAKLQDGTNFTGDTRLSIGSNSKLFTVTATGLLISNETVTPRISWNTKIDSVIPEWELMDSDASEKASIIDLMSHRTGLPRHDFMYRQSDTLQSMTFQYNNIMYNVLSYLPEVLSTKTTVARYVKQHIFEALGMNSTTYSFDIADASGNLADGVCRENLTLTSGLPGTGRPRSLPYWFKDGGEDGNFMAGAGGVISTANDMAIWLQTLLLWGKHPQTGEVIIPESVLRTVASGVTVVDPRNKRAVLSPVVYSGGQQIGTYRGHGYIEHGGDVGGAHSRVARLPFDNIGVAVLTNDDDLGPIFNDIIKYRLIDEALGLEPFDWDTLQRMIPNSHSGPRVLTAPGFVVEFATADDGSGIGMAMNGGFWGAGTGVPEPSGDTVEQRAEVWFRQVQASI